MTQKIGIEHEGFFLDTEGNQVDTAARLGADTLPAGGKFAALTRDMAESSFEMITDPCTNGSEVREWLDKIRGLFPAGLVPVFEPRPVVGAVRLVRDKPRAIAMDAALSKEHDLGHIGIASVAPWCAIHAHIGVDDVTSPESVLLLNVLNDIAPFARLETIKRYGVRGDEGHLRAWQGWCKPERVPDKRWFKSPTNMKSFIGDIPKLVMKVGDEWVPGDGTKSKLGEAESEGTLWWLARPRAVYQTIEWRPFPSMNPEYVPDLVDNIFVLVKAFHDYVADHPAILQDNNEIKLVQPMYRYLTRASRLVPATPLFYTGDWWTQYKI